jgi:hypothetical protein
MKKALMTITAISCGALSPLGTPALADDSQIGACDVIELVTIIDPSESLDPNKQLCQAIQVAWEGLDPDRLQTMVVENQGNEVFCSDGSVNELYPLSPGWIPGTSIDSYEDWGDAISVVCSSRQWGSGPRMLLVFSDECAEGGDDVSFPCNVDETGAERCGLEDRLAIDRALQAALNHDVRIIAVATQGACSEVVDEMYRLADGSGGRLIEQSRLADQSSHGLGVAIRDRIVSLMPDFWSSCCEDFNRDGMVGAADLATILSSWGAVDAAIDLDQSGRVDVGDLGRLLAAWGGCR